MGNLSKGALALAAILIIATASAATTRAAEYPAAFRGLWYSGASCDKIEGFVFTGKKFQLMGGLSPLANGKFRYVPTGADVILTATPDRIVTRGTRQVPTPRPGQLVSEIKNGQRAFYWQGEEAQGWRMFHCKQPRTAAASASTFVFFLVRLGTLEAGAETLLKPCGNGAATPGPCAAAVVKLLDINGDGKLSPAEITTFMRRYAPVMTFFGGDQDNGNPQEIDPATLAGIEGATAILGPFMTNVVLSNFDYDGNGFLSTGEIVLALKQENAAGTSIDAASLLSQSQKQLDNAMGAVGGLTQMLGGGAGHGMRH
ncbi:MAG: hypothetical protein ACREFD_03395 [Stellaceae bacterium]